MTTPMTPAPGYDGPGAVPLAAPRAKIRPGRIWYVAGLLVFQGWRSRRAARSAWITLADT